jgi:hypothetical protein
MVFYEHAYHTWCTIFHFSSLSKCLFKGCGEEINIDWWALSGIKKPCEDDKGREGANHWTMATCIMDNLQDEFIMFI